jgi:peptidoglycan/LPS O-acetylase OafA/YrhL
LFWPAVLLWLGNRRSLWFAAVAAVSSATWRFWLGTHPLLRAGHWISSPTFGFSTLRTDARLDGLLIGSGLALLLNLPRVHQFVFRNFPKETPLLAGCLLYINLFRTRSLPAFSSYVLLALILASTLIVKEGLAYKWLNFRPLVWIGSISYSLYLWNELFLLRPSGSPALGRFSELPLNLICAFCAASASYYLVERPLKAYGNRCLRQRDTLPAEVTVNP